MNKVVKKKIKIGGMHCSSCTMLIDGDLEDLGGVISSRTNYIRGECEVEFDSDQISHSKIIETIEKTGYKVLG